MPNPEPIFLELDGQKREIAFTVGSALTLRENGFDAQKMVESLPDSVDGQKRYRIFPEVVVHHLAACLQRESRRTGDVLDAEWVEDKLDTEVKLWEAATAVGRAVARYYGQESAAGEAKRPARVRRAKATS